VLGHVTNQMTVAREEIFGPVVVVIGYDTVDEAVRIANDTPYGLAAYVSGTDLEQVRKVAAAARRPGQHQRRRARPDGALRRLQAERQRPRVGRPRLRRVPGTKAVLGYAPKQA
jgi:aldehyde dehydrogenase (NAD+)